MHGMGRVLRMVWRVVGIAFAAYIAVTIYKSGGRALPSVIEHFRSFFQDGLEMYFSSWIFGVFVIVMAAGITFHKSRHGDWRQLSECFSGKHVDFDEPHAFTYEGGRFGQELRRGRFKVGFSKSGIVFKEVFPFHWWYPSIYLPWEGIERIEIQKSKLCNNGLFRKVVEFLSPFKYARINLAEYPEQIIFVGWKDVYIKYLPPEMMAKYRDL